MTTWSSNLLLSLVVAMLTASLSVCCCQTNVLFAVSDHDEPSCCANCPDETPDNQNETPPPSKGCLSCCIKGTGLKDTTLVLPDRDVAAIVPPLALPTGIVQFPTREPCCVPGLAATPLHLVPPTLVRLHCALLV